MRLRMDRRDWFYFLAGLLIGGLLGIRGGWAEVSTSTEILMGHSGLCFDEHSGEFASCEAHLSQPEPGGTDLGVCGLRRWEQEDRVFCAVVCGGYVVIHMDFDCAPPEERK